MGWDGYQLTRSYLSGYPITEYPLIYWAGKGQKMTNPQGAGRISQMEVMTDIQLAPTPSTKKKKDDVYDEIGCER